MGTILSSLFGAATNALGGIYGYLAAAALSGAVAAYGSWYVTHGLDGNAYKALQLADAQAVIAQQQADASALAAFQERSGAAQAAAETAVQASRVASQAEATKLQAELAAAEKKDAPLAHCLARRLPAGVLDSLPR